MVQEINAGIHGVDYRAGFGAIALGRDRASSLFDSLKIVSGGMSMFACVLLFCLVVLFLGTQPLYAAHVDISDSCNMSLDSVKGAIDGFDGISQDGHVVMKTTTYVVESQGDNMASTSRGGSRDVLINIGAKAKALSLLMFGTDLINKPENFQPPSNIDEFYVEIRFADGTIDIAFPFNSETRSFSMTNGLGSYRVFTSNADLAIDHIRLVNNVPNNRIHVLAVNLENDELSFNDKELYKPLTWDSSHVAPGEEELPLIFLEKDIIYARNSYYTLELDIRQGLRLAKLVNNILGVSVIQEDRNTDVFNIEVDGTGIRSSQLNVVSVEQIQKQADNVELLIRLSSGKMDVVCTIGFSAKPEIDFQVSVTNVSPTMVRITPEAPYMQYMSIGADATDDMYFFPRKGGLISDTQVSFSQQDIWALYGQNISTPFVVVADRVLDGGVYIIVRDVENEPKFFGFSKRNYSTLRVRYAYARTLEPGETWEIAPWTIGVNVGDWRFAFEQYKQWVRTWYSHRGSAEWIRDEFNLRNAFSRHHGIGTQLRDNGTYMEEFIREGQELYGGYDYIHWQDWWSKVGDYEIDDKIRRAVEVAKTHDIRVGMYIEGLLFAKDGDIAQRYGDAWEMKRADGGVYDFWPSCFACLSLEEWKQHLVDSAVRLASELPLDGIYVDEFGFGITNFCYRKEHEHECPNRPMDEQVSILMRIRKALDEVRPGIALYIESPGSDWMSQLVDAVFGYNLSKDIEEVPPYEPSYIDIYRFAFPEVKVFSIASGQFDEYLPGMKRAFFNGNGIWYAELKNLMSPGGAGFIAKSTKIMKENRDAINAMQPQPLLPSLDPMILVNYFPCEGKELYTFLNRGHFTFRGRVFEVPFRKNARYIDVWNERPVHIEVNNAEMAYLYMDLYPGDVSAVAVVERKIYSQFEDGVLSIDIPEKFIGSTIEVIGDNVTLFEHVVTEKRFDMRLEDVESEIIVKLIYNGILLDMEWVSYEGGR